MRLLRIGEGERCPDAGINSSFMEKIDERSNILVDLAAPGFHALIYRVQFDARASPQLRERQQEAEKQDIPEIAAPARFHSACNAKGDKLSLGSSALAAL
jgi:hypothetical protein